MPRPSAARQNAAVISEDLAALDAAVAASAGGSAMAKARWARVPPGDRSTQAGDLARNRWATLTPEQRSAEMRRRAQKRRKAHRPQKARG